MKTKLTAAFIISLTLFIGISHGEVIRLKNGNLIRGKVILETKAVVRINDASTGKEVTLNRAEVENIVDDRALEGTVDLKALKKLKSEDWVKLEEKSKSIQSAKSQTEPTAPGFPEKFRPRLGVQVNYLMPSGNIGSALDPAIGGGLLLDMRIPVFNPEGGAELRTGLSAGYASFSSTVENFPATVTIIPLLLNNEIGYITESGFRPYLKLGLGVSMASLTDDSDNTEKKDTSSMDFTILAGAGAGYRNKNLPSVELFLEAGYLMLFEKTSGNFINVSFGVSYHFYSREDSHENTSLAPK